MDNRLIKITAGAAAAVVIAFGGIAIGRSGSGDSAAATNGFPGGGTAMQRGEGGPPDGFAGGAPGGGTEVTGTAAQKVEQAALAKYPGAEIERIVGLPDGSYVAHVVTGDGEIHVAVSKSFEVTGTADDGGPPQGMAPGDGGDPGAQSS
jgi:hypothetical protein